MEGMTHSFLHAKGDCSRQSRGTLLVFTTKAPAGISILSAQIARGTPRRPLSNGVEGLVEMNFAREDNAVGLQISVRQYNDVTILDLSGKSTINAGESELLSKRLRALTDNGKRKVLLNLANLTHMDSTGISAIIESYVCLERQDGALKLLGPRGRVLEVLTLFRLLQTIPSFEDENQALASF